MKRRSNGASTAEDVASLNRELVKLRTEAERRQRLDDERRRLDAVSHALVGELDREDLLARAERLATAALGRPCVITANRSNGNSIPLGSEPPAAWLSIGDSSVGPADDVAAIAVADIVGRALDAARQVEVQTEAMRKLERSLLPEVLLQIDGLQLASRYLPAQGHHDVGGDFYDAIVVDDRVTLIVGDVQGKGIDAATLTSMARHTLRAGALAGLGPAVLLEQLNRALLYGQAEQLSAGNDPVLRFVTAAVALLERSSTETAGFDVTVARAGQPPPIIVRSDGPFVTVEPSGMLLGVSAEPHYEEVREHLAVGDALVMYTDGVIEQRVGESKAMTEQHLGMLVRNRRGIVDAEAIAQLIEDTVRLVAPEDVRDDVAILVACPVR
jgi:sigma-B regulation protein RsbU (phosphoserine phosphatase)